MVKVKLSKGTPMWFGSYPLRLPADQMVEFLTLNTLDEVAEVLAGHAAAFALNKDRFTHETVKYDRRGKAYTVHVAYGLGGAKVESNPKQVAAQAALQQKNVAAAEKQAAKDAAEAKKAEKGV